MKRLISACVIAATALPIMAADTLTLPAGKQLEATVIGTQRLNEGDVSPFVQLHVDPSQIGHNTENCIVSSELSLKQGTLALTAQRLWCLQPDGHFYRGALAATAVEGLANTCQQKHDDQCTLAQLDDQHTLTLELTETAEIPLIINSSEQVNKMRLEQTPSEAPAE